MADCRYCGQRAGLLSRAHNECQARREAGWRAMAGKAAEAALGHSAAAGLYNELTLIADGSFIRREEIPAILMDGWNTAIDFTLERRLPTREEEAALYGYLAHFRLNAGNAAHRLRQAAALREVVNGNLPRTIPSPDLPFVFQKSESLVWVFDAVRYYERRTRRVRQGVSHGASIRIMQGLYYHPRVFRSETHESNVTQLVDSGVVALTSKHIYFSGKEKGFRIAYSRVVSFDGDATGFSVIRDAASARPQIFNTGDGWFAYNLVVNLARS